MTECIPVACPNMNMFAPIKTGSGWRLPHLLIAIMFLASATVAFCEPPDFAEGKASAEKFYSEGSYAKAREVYAKMDISSLSKEDARWVQFRLADTQWRSAAATGNPDTSEL